MRVAVTGAAGFLGSHVADHLAASQCEVKRLDLAADSLRGIVAADLLQPQRLVEAIDGVDAVCHLGGVGDVYLAMEDPALAARANILGTINLLEACRRVGVRKFVFASTWEVYGTPQREPMDEQHPCDPEHPYNISKLAAERFTMLYDHAFGVPAISLRIGTSWGERMRSNSVFFLFIDKALTGRPLQIQGTGAQARQFTHAADVAEAFRLAIHADCRGEVFNIVAEQSVSILQLAQLVAERIPTRFEFLPARAADIPTARVSAHKAERLLGWRARVSLADGLPALIRARRAALGLDETPAGDRSRQPAASDRGPALE